MNDIRLGFDFDFGSTLSYVLSREGIQFMDKSKTAKAKCRVFTRFSERFVLQYSKKSIVSSVFPSSVGLSAKKSSSFFNKN